MSAESGSKIDYTRAELIRIAERAVVPVEKWHDRDSASAQEGVARALGLLKAGVEFTVIPPHPEGNRGCFTDDRTIWVEFKFPGFRAFEYGPADRSFWNDETIYLPTPARLEAAAGRDWY